LRELSVHADRQVLRLLCDRRDELSRARAQGLNRMHRLMAELVPGGAPVKKSVAQYQALLTAVRPRDPVGRTQRRLAAEQLHELTRLDARLTTLKGELKAAVLASGSHLMGVVRVKLTSSIYGLGTRRGRLHPVFVNACGSRRTAGCRHTPEHPTGKPTTEPPGH
jgi:hypothetical protein